MDSANDVISAHETREILGVADEQLDELVAQGLLTRIDEGGSSGFRRAEVEAARLQGG